MLIRYVHRMGHLPARRTETTSDNLLSPEPKLRHDDAKRHLPASIPFHRLPHWKRPTIRRANERETGLEPATLSLGS
jgi:hypothetical protein